MNAQFLAQLIHFLLENIKLLFVGLILVIQGLDAAQRLVLAQVDPVIAISFGDGIGNAGLWDVSGCKLLRRQYDIRIFNSWCCGDCFVNSRTDIKALYTLI